MGRLPGSLWVPAALLCHPREGPAPLAPQQTPLNLPPASSQSHLHQIHQDPEHQNDDEAGRDQLAAVPAGGGLPPAHVHQRHGGDRQAARPPGPGLALEPPAAASVPRLAGHGGFCPGSRARTGWGCFLPTLLPSGDSGPPACPSIPRIFLSPSSRRVCLQDPSPMLGVSVDEPGHPACSSRHGGRGQPQPCEEPPAHASSCLRPRRGGRDPAPLGELGGSLPALQEAGCRLPPSPALELLLPQAGWELPGPPEQAGSG